jgi:ubiquitin C-terminal hydrolase
LKLKKIHGFSFNNFAKIFNDEYFYKLEWKLFEYLHNNSRSMTDCTLTNLGYNCYFNSVLQAIVKIPSLNLFFKLNPFRDTNHLRNLIYKIEDKIGQYSPLQFFTFIGENSDFFDLKQHSALKFLKFLFSQTIKFEKETMEIKNEKFCKENFLQHLMSKYSSNFVENFLIISQRKIFCQTCKKIAKYFEADFILAIDLEKQNEQICFEKILNEKNFTICECLNKIESTLELLHLPQNLILVFNRNHNNSKITKEIKFSLNKLRIKDFDYNTVASINHIGNSTNQGDLFVLILKIFIFFKGHYVCVVRDFEKTWKVFSDATVSSTEFSFKDNYIVFLERIEKNIVFLYLFQIFMKIILISFFSVSKKVTFF